VTAGLLRIELGAPIAECRCVVIDGKGVAVYVADIIYRSDAIKLHIDLLAGARASLRTAARGRAKGRAAGGSQVPLRSCN
jgi:GntR family transcriptional regulator